MKPESAALSALSVEAPNLSRDSVAQAVEAQFGLAGEYAPLVSERDQNFRLRVPGGDQFVVKVTSGSESSIATDFQIGALRHLEKTDIANVPRVIPALDGEPFGRIVGDTGSHRLRVVTWIAGESLEAHRPDTTRIAEFGAALAHLDKAFAGYTHAGESPVLPWDLQRVPELRQLTDSIDSVEVRNSVTCAIEDFETHVDPVLGELRAQVIHSDANPGNVLLTDSGIGFIDFSDIVKAPCVFDVAIAMSYLRSFDAEPLRFIVPFVAAYHDVLPIDSLEADLLFDLVRARLATTVTMLYWRLSSRPADDPYRQKALTLEGDAARFLNLLDSTGALRFRRSLSFID